MPSVDPVILRLEAEVDTYNTKISQAERLSDSSFRKIEQSAGRVDGALQATGGASRVLGQQFSQMGQQVAAGTSVMQAFAIQMPDLVVGMQSAGVEARGLAGFFLGPWGIALTTAASLALALSGDILKIGDAADESSSALEGMIQRYRQAMAERNKFAASGQELGDLVKRRDQLQGEITRRGVRGSNGQLQFVYRQQQELAEVNRQIAEGRAARDQERRNDAFGPITSSMDLVNRNIPEPRERRTRTSRAGKTEAQREAERAAKEAERQEKQYAQTKRQLELEQTLDQLRGSGADRAADKLEIIARLQDQFPELANSTKKADQERLAILQAIATATIDEAHNRKEAKDSAELRAKQAKEDADIRKKASDELARRQEEQVRSLASIYESAFRGGTSAIWRDFKSIGFQVIAETLARFTLSKINGGSGGIGDFFSTAITSVLGFSTGGSGVIGGRGGTDQNLLSLNGQPLARVSRGEDLSIGRMNAASPQAQQITVVVQANDYFDARVAGISRKVASPIAASAAQQAGQAVYAAALRDVPAMQAKRQRFG